MSRCTCRDCRIRNRPCHTDTVEVEFGFEITRPGWETAHVWGEVTTEHTLRAEVTFRTLSEDPEVAWLDKGMVEDLALTDNEERAAEIQAIDTALDKLSKREEEDSEVDRAIDAELDRWKEEREMVRSA